jgi:hypothetical protein
VTPPLLFLVNLKTTPHPSGQVPGPPRRVVPYRFPFASIASPETGSPAVAMSKVCSTFSRLAAQELGIRIRVTARTATVPRGAHDNFEVRLGRFFRTEPLKFITFSLLFITTEPGLLTAGRCHNSYLVLQLAGNPSAFRRSSSVPPPACKQCNICRCWNNPEACRYSAAPMGLT